MNPRLQPQNSANSGCERSTSAPEGSAARFEFLVIANEATHPRANPKEFRVVQLQLKTWQFVDDYLKSKTGIMIPIGSTEQHGPTGLIGTDALTAEMIARGAGEKVGALVAPTISVGMAQHHLAFAGSVTLRPTTLIAVVRDTVVSLARHGFTRFFFVNGHGGNIATVTAAFSEIYAERSMERMSNQPSIKCALRNWWDGPGIRALQKELYPSGEGSHATASEVALTWYKYPETMQRKEMEPKIAPNGSFADAEDYRRVFPDGRIGSDPNQATPEHGKRFYDTAVEEVARDYEKWVADRRSCSSGPRASCARFRDENAPDSAAHALAMKDVEAGRHDDRDAGHRQRVGHLAPHDVADGERPQDRGVAERADHRELAARAQRDDHELVAHRQQERGAQR